MKPVRSSSARKDATRVRGAFVLVMDGRARADEDCVLAPRHWVVFENYPATSLVVKRDASERHLAPLHVLQVTLGATVEGFHRGPDHVRQSEERDRFEFFIDHPTHDPVDARLAHGNRSISHAPPISNTTAARHHTAIGTSLIGPPREETRARRSRPDRSPSFRCPGR